MAGVSAQGATFSFTGLTATVTRVAVESPQAEIVDMTSTAVTSASMNILVPTGAWTGGGVRVDFIHPRSSIVSMTTFTRETGFLSFQSQGFTVPPLRVICESVSAEASVNDIVRGSMSFVLTDSTHMFSTNAVSVT